MSVEVSIVMPCLDEAETVEACIAKARGFLEDNGVTGEIIIADNGSTDGSQRLARAAGARVVDVPQRGYGAALMGGIASARGRFVIMGDADGSYDFTRLGLFLEELRKGADLVMGNRFRGGVARGAMPPLHYYLGNPALTGVGRLFFRSAAHDFHCGLRAVRKSAYESMALRTTGMEFASEMVVKATLLEMRIVEVPTTLSPSGRSRAPHLRSWRDGWRHLRFMLLYSPRWLFLYPGFLMMALGTGVGLWLLPGPRTLGGVTLDVHTLLYAAALVLVGFQAVLFATFAKTFAVTEGLLPPDPKFMDVYRYVTLETGLAAGAGMILIGLVGTLRAVWLWDTLSFGPLDPARGLRIIIPAVLCLTLGSQTVLASFFLSVLGLTRK